MDQDQVVGGDAGFRSDAIDRDRQPGNGTGRPDGQGIRHLVVRPRVGGIDPVAGDGFYACQIEFGISRDDLYKKLKEYNIFTRRYFYPLCSQFQCYSKYPSSAPENLPVAERVSKSIMTLPLYGSLSKEDIHKISDIITLHAKRNARNFKVQSFCLPN